MPEAAIWQANSRPMPDDAPVISAQGPNRFFSICVFITCFHCLSYVHSVGLAMRAVVIVVETRFRRGFNFMLALVFSNEDMFVSFATLSSAKFITWSRR